MLHLRNIAKLLSRKSIATFVLAVGSLLMRDWNTVRPLSFMEHRPRRLWLKALLITSLP